MEQVQESRKQVASIAVTATEKTAIRFVAAHREIPESELLRSLLISDVVEEYDRLMAALRQLPPAV
jgi:hypothetical protein